MGGLFIHDVINKVYWMYTIVYNRHLYRHPYRVLSIHKLSIPNTNLKLDIDDWFPNHHRGTIKGSFCFRDNHHRSSHITLYTAVKMINNCTAKRGISLGYIHLPVLNARILIVAETLSYLLLSCNYSVSWEMNNDCVIIHRIIV